MMAQVQRYYHVAVYCENHVKHTDTLRGQNAEFYYVCMYYFFIIGGVGLSP
jgi:hypothetical protein